jgi:CheY-like chemotaxis protein
VPLSILVVDDDPDFLTLATRLLESMGVEVVATAQDAASALAAANEKKPDAALVDVGLPDRNGIDLGAELATLQWRPRVVLTSTDSDVESEVERQEQGVALPFIPKEELAAERLRRLLGVD